MASAKDAFGLLQQLEGPQLVTTTWYNKQATCDDGLTMDNKKGAHVKGKKFASYVDTCGPAKTTELVEFAYVGGNELWLVRPSGKEQAHIPGLGAQNIEWSDEEGNRYQIGTSEGPLVEGQVFYNKAIVGSFVLNRVRLALHPLDGRWSGQMGFPGGFLYQMNLMSTGTVRPISDDCGVLSARMEFSDAPYADLELVLCQGGKSGESTISFAMLYWDITTNTSWFLSFDAFVESGALQGSVTAMPLFGGDVQQGAFILLPPQPFLPVEDEK